MNQLVTTAIILQRTDYGEADRILTLLTPDYGKVRLLAKGVRRVKSKLAGGIELFSVSEITFIKGKSEIGTLVSTRLDRHYDQIVKDLDRTMLGYELIKSLHKATEDEADPEYFAILREVFAALNDPTISLQFVRYWFRAQLLRLGGRTPNLQTDDQGSKLSAARTYTFDFEHMLFSPTDASGMTADHIKLLRLTFDGHSPSALMHVQGIGKLLPPCDQLVQHMTNLL